MNALGFTMLSLSLAGLCAAGPVAAQTTKPAGGSPPSCQPAKAPQMVVGQVVDINATGDKIKVRDTSGAMPGVSTPATLRECSPSASSFGNSEQVCASGPSPRRWATGSRPRSVRSPSARRVLAAPRPARRVRVHSGSSARGGAWRNGDVSV